MRMPKMMKNRKTTKPVRSNPGILNPGKSDTPVNKRKMNFGIDGLRAMQSESFDGLRDKKSNLFDGLRNKLNIQQPMGMRQPKPMAQPEPLQMQEPESMAQPALQEIQQPEPLQMDEPTGPVNPGRNTNLAGMSEEDAYLQQMTRNMPGVAFNTDKALAAFRAQNENKEQQSQNVGPAQQDQQMRNQLMPQQAPQQAPQQGGSNIDEQIMQLEKQIQALRAQKQS